MGQVKYFRLSSSLFVLAALTATESVNAQEAPAPPASAGGQLEEIIVTAQKRRERMQDLPVSVTSISGSALQNLKLTDASQLAVQVPNLTVQTPFGEVQPIFAMRGVSLVDYSQHQQGPIGMYVDEDYKGAGVFRAQQLYDIDRVEVLRGPQGTLFGRNTTGGAVNIYTVQPDLDGAEGFVTAGVGNYGLREGNWDYAVVADFDDADGWRAYTAHPAHRQVLVELIEPVVGERAAAQFEY